MSVMVTLRFKADADKLEAWAAEHEDEIRGIADTAGTHGNMAHRFYGSDAGDIMVLDEWPDSDSFHTFFGSTQDRIMPMMEAIGVQAEPEIKFWRELETQDKRGWGA